MAELTVDDVEWFTGGALAADGDETQRILDAALAAARADVGWHVSPVLTDDVLTVDGPGGTRLRLPTRKIVSVTELVEAGVSLDPLADITVSASVPGLIVKTGGGYWTGAIAGITITLDHGYTEDEAADWRQAVLQMCKEMGSAAGRSDADLVSKQVDDVVYRWGPLAAKAAYTADTVLDRYRLNPGMA